MYRLVGFYFLFWKWMKDVIKRMIIGLVSGAFLGYLGVLASEHMMIVQGAYTEQNVLFYLLIAAIILVVFIFFAVYPVHFKMTK